MNAISSSVTRIFRFCIINQEMKWWDKWLIKPVTTWFLSVLVSVRLNEANVCSITPASTFCIPGLYVLTSVIMCLPAPATFSWLFQYLVLNIHNYKLCPEFLCGASKNIFQFCWIELNMNDPTVDLRWVWTENRLHGSDDMMHILMVNALVQQVINEWIALLKWMPCHYTWGWTSM